MAELKTNKPEIRIISPSGVINPDLIDGATERLKSWGFEVSEGRYAREVYGRYAGTELQRAHDLQEALDDDGLTAVLCSRGGYGLAQIIDKINFSSIQHNHKWLIGFSDVTIIHAALSNLNVPSVHGAMAKHLTELPENADSLQFLKLLMEGHHPVYQLPPDVMNREGSVKGKLIGGNLSVLMGLRGTPFDFDYRGAILFLEDVGERAYHIDRMMQNLRLGGVFSIISGLIIGHFTDCKEDSLMHKSIKKIISDVTAGYHFPVCFGLPAGHEKINYPLILGRELSLQVGPAATILDFS
ncbi:MAG: LD-carboxypeptidase [Paludibacter sp.]|nr:LD-carboxypeptidase [Paludibacter sp.]MDD4198015.1 LD-carboxypeptidase [Paludibacter sp.]MDD4428585.1 LD-carboxypeptidase [Paludibacter sp.]